MQEKSKYKQRQLILQQWEPGHTNRETLEEEARDCKNTESRNEKMEHRRHSCISVSRLCWHRMLDRGKQLQAGPDELLAGEDCVLHSELPVSVGVCHQEMGWRWRAGTRPGRRRLHTAALEHVTSCSFYLCKDWWDLTAGYLGMLRHSSSGILIVMCVTCENMCLCVLRVCLGGYWCILALVLYVSTCVLTPPLGMDMCTNNLSFPNKVWISL